MGEAIRNRYLDALAERIELPTAVAQPEVIADVACNQDIDAGDLADRLQNRDMERGQEAPGQPLMPLIAAWIAKKENDDGSVRAVHHYRSRTRGVHDCTDSATFDHDTCMRTPHADSAARLPNRRYNAGTTNIFSAVDVNRPQRITIAIGV